MIGEVGAGKSTLVEKICDEKNRSSCNGFAETQCSEIFESYDRRLEIADTPGTNPLKKEDILEHNLSIAHAFNFQPVSCILIVADAQTRIARTYHQIKEYIERFLPPVFPQDLIGVCITHMDLVKWTEKDMLEELEQGLHIKTAIFRRLDTPKQVLV